jgi:hypothetical protein
MKQAHENAGRWAHLAVAGVLLSGVAGATVHAYAGYREVVAPRPRPVSVAVPAALVSPAVATPAVWKVDLEPQAPAARRESTPSARAVKFPAAVPVVLPGAIPGPLPGVAPGRRTPASGKFCSFGFG